LFNEQTGEPRKGPPVLPFTHSKPKGPLFGLLPAHSKRFVQLTSWEQLQDVQELQVKVIR